MKVGWERVVDNLYNVYIDIEGVKFTTSVWTQASAEKLTEKIAKTLLPCTCNDEESNPFTGCFLHP